MRRSTKRRVVRARLRAEPFAPRLQGGTAAGGSSLRARHLRRPARSRSRQGRPSRGLRARGGGRAGLRRGQPLRRLARPHRPRSGNRRHRGAPRHARPPRPLDAPAHPLGAGGGLVPGGPGGHREGRSSRALPARSPAARGRTLREARARAAHRPGAGVPRGRARRLPPTRLAALRRAARPLVHRGTDRGSPRSSGPHGPGV